MGKEESPLTKMGHVGMVVRDIDKAVAHFEKLGIGPFKRSTLPAPGYTFSAREHYGKSVNDSKYATAYARLGSIGLEIFQPISGDTIPQRFLDTKGEGIWHFGYDVEDMEETKAWMAERGFKVVGSSTYHDGTLMCYFDTADPGGVLFQAHQSKGGHKKPYEKI